MKPLTLILLLATLALCAKAASVPDIMILEEDDEEDKRDKRALSFIADKISSKFASKFGYHEGPPLPPPPRHELEYGPPISYHSKNFDIWAFKKAIFNALFQAVKAIKGGIIAFKGQLIKAKGHILATKGHILQAKGDAITNFGRELASKSLLEPEIVYDAPEEPPIHLGPTSYGAHSSTIKETVPPPLPTKSSVPEYKPEPTYEAPLSSSNSYGLFKEAPKEPPKDYSQSGLPGGVQAGLLVLKPINVPSSGSGGGDAGGHFAEPPGSYSASQSGGGSQSFGGGPQPFGGGSQSFGGGSQSFGGGSQSFGGGPQSFGGGPQSFGGGPQSFGGGPPSFGNYAGPLSPAAYDSFGGHGDLSASYSQSAAQSNQRKRASPLIIPPVAPPQPRGRPHIYYHNPNFAYRQ